VHKPAGAAVVMPGPERREIDLEAHGTAQALTRDARRIGKRSAFHHQPNLVVARMP